MSKLLSPLFTDLKFRTIGTSRATAEKFYYDKRHLSYIRLQTTKESNRDPRKRESIAHLAAGGGQAKESVAINFGRLNHERIQGLAKQFIERK